MPKCVRESIIKYREEFFALENKRRKVLAEGLKLEEAMVLRGRLLDRKRVR